MKFYEYPLSGQALSSWSDSFRYLLIPEDELEMQMPVAEPQLLE